MRSHENCYSYARMSNARFLLSDAALPELVEPTRQPRRTEQKFRLPSCIGKPADYKLDRERGAEVIETEARSDSTPAARFAERTMKWFTVGDEQAEQERRDHRAMVRSLRRRRAAAIVAAVSAAAVAALLVVLI